MPWLNYAYCAFGGAFFTNAVPHFVSAVMGRPFQTPFAKPHGVGLSSSTVNALWACFNLAVAYVLSYRLAGIDLHAGDQAMALGLGILLCSVGLARLFGRLHGGNAPLGKPE
jgi:hypothetical protein